MSITRTLSKLCGSLLSATLLLAVTPAVAQVVPTHVVSAESLLANLTISRQNNYASNPSFITWAGTSSQARTVCATFITNLLEHSYGWTSTTFTSWLGTTSPFATDYHDAIVAQKGFADITNVTSVLPGDIIAVKYPAGSGTTGHAMLVDGVPHAQSAISPAIAGTTQYVVTILDSTSTHHGAADTRVTSPSSTKNGIGRGELRLYVNAASTIVGYAWSNDSGSPYYPATSRPIAIGRVDINHVSGKTMVQASGGSGQGVGYIALPDDGSTTQVPNSDMPGMTDDETKAPANSETGGDSVNLAEAGGCSMSARPQAPAAAPVVGLALFAGLLGLRRRRTSAVASR